MKVYLCILVNDILEQGIEAYIEGVVLKPLSRNDHAVRCDDESNMLNGNNNDIVSDQNFACLACEQIGIKKTHVSDGHAQL